MYRPVLREPCHGTASCSNDHFDECSISNHLVPNKDLKQYAGNIQKSSQRAGVVTPTMRQSVVRLSSSARLFANCSRTSTATVPHALKLKTALGEPGKAPVELGLHRLYCKSICITSLTKCERQHENASNALDVQMVRRSIGSSFGVEVFEVPGCEVTERDEGDGTC